MKFSVLGAGRWGSFIAWYLDKIGNNVTLWGKETSEKIQKLLKSRQNEYVTIPESINLSTDLEESIKNSDYIIISISSQGLRGLAEEINVYIGDENENEDLKDLSIVTFKHKVAGKDLGTIGIIGPKRMNYSKVISIMKYISKKLNEGE